jgi:hypothetical protein
MHNDDTSHCQTSLVNAVLSLLTENDQFKTICMDGGMITENSLLDAQCLVIIGSIDESIELLAAWRAETERMFHGCADLVAEILDPTLWMSCIWLVVC